MQHDRQQSCQKNRQVLCEALHLHFSRTPEVSDRRRQERWSARGALELPPSAERSVSFADNTPGVNKSESVGIVNKGFME